MVRNSIRRRTPLCRRKLDDISAALERVMPGISARRDGSFSNTSRLCAPNRSTIFAAVFAPMPLTAREER